MAIILFTSTALTDLTFIDSFNLSSMDWLVISVGLEQEYIREPAVLFEEYRIDLNRTIPAFRVNCSFLLKEFDSICANIP